jgi:hypothetical protein
MGGINFNLFLNCLQNGEFLKAASYIIYLVEQYDANSNYIYENEIYLCILNNIICFMIDNELLDSRCLTEEDCQNIERLKELSNRCEEKGLNSLIENNIRYGKRKIVLPDKISAIIELILYTHCGLASMISSSLQSQEKEGFNTLYHVLEVFHRSVFSKMKLDGYIDYKNALIDKLIIGRRYKVLKYLYSVPNVASLLSGQENYSQKIKAMIVVLDELLKLEGMSKDKFDEYVASLPIGTHIDESESVFDMVIGHDFMSAYELLRKTDGRGSHKLYFLLEQYVNAVRPNMPNPNMVGPHTAVVLSLAQLNN